MSNNSDYCEFYEQGVTWRFIHIDEWIFIGSTSYFLWKKWIFLSKDQKKNGSGSPAGMIWKIQNKKEWYLLAT